MHFTETVYRNPYWPTFPLLQITQGCTHNKCKFCSMYKDVDFRLQPLEWVEEDLKEIAEISPDATTIQLLSANPLVMSFEKLKHILELINKYLPNIEYIYTQGRVSDLKNKTVAQLKELRALGMKEISLGVESGDDWTLERINKGYTSEDILTQCHKLEEAGIDYWMTFLNGVAGAQHSREHAIESAHIFSQCKPKVVGTGGLTLFPDTPLLQEAQKGEFTPLSESQMLEELLLFVENLTCDATFITHHTISGINLTESDFLKRKDQIISSLRHEIKYGNHDQMAMIRNTKKTL
ncbi:radical SAM protein [Kandleria vitulina]|uniref:radical SAM protein n=1 Tax=Kandleria vitulina TaxID=1630 RepID=UPI003328DFD9